MGKQCLARERIRKTHPLPPGEGKCEGITVYRGLRGFGKSATLEEVHKHGYVLTPGRYVGAEPQEDDGELFQDKMARLTAQWREQQAEGARLDSAIAGLGRMPADQVWGSEDRRYFMERRGDGVPVIQRETLGVSGRPAEFRVVANADLLVVLPSAPLTPGPAQVQITVHAQGQPLHGADILALYPIIPGEAPPATTTV